MLEVVQDEEQVLTTQVSQQLLVRVDGAREGEPQC